MVWQPDPLLKTHNFVFNKEDNGGESLILTTKMFDNGDPAPHGIYWNQELTLHSYGNSATFNLYGTTITPELLRKLADELEKAQEDAVNKLNEV